MLCNYIIVLKVKEENEKAGEHIIMSEISE